MSSSHSKLTNTTVDVVDEDLNYMGKMEHVTGLLQVKALRYCERCADIETLKSNHRKAIKVLEKQTDDTIDTAEHWRWKFIQLFRIAWGMTLCDKCNESAEVPISLLCGHMICEPCARDYLSENEGNADPDSLMLRCPLTSPDDKSSTATKCDYQHGALHIEPSALNHSKDLFHLCWQLQDVVRATNKDDRTLRLGTTMPAMLWKVKDQVEGKVVSYKDGKLFASDDDSESSDD